jgi:hypothetical protein
MSKPLIKDEFTHLKGQISRQRIWQLRKHKEHKCIKCGKPEGKCKWYCDDCYELLCTYIGVNKPFRNKDK